VVATDDGTALPVTVHLSYPNAKLNDRATTTYTSWGNWISKSGQANLGYFAYGIPTPAGQVPTTGSASYEAKVMGQTLTKEFYIDGTATLDFDFAAGKLSGFMKVAVCPWDCDIDIPRYDFAETVYSRGSRTFSGKFTVPDSTAASGFSGSFNDPQAAEVMARWFAPWFDPTSKQWDQMAGIWIGKKKP
jgi:hypothetical protein